MEILSTLSIAIGAFVATNIDDVFVLMMFFSQTDRAFRRRHVVIGQYIGFIALIAVSLLGFLGSFVVPKEWIGLLGLAPIAIGIHKFANRKSETKASEQIGGVSSSSSIVSGLLNPKIYGVAVVTFANGGDNIGIYTPLFASSDLLRLIVIVGAFLTLVGVWCFLGYKLTHQRTVAQVLFRYGHLIVPFVLIGLGVYIIVENETLRLLGL